MRKRLLLVVLLLISPSLSAQQSGVTLRTTTLLATPHSDAKKVTTLKPRTPLQILKRQGGWYQVWNGGKYSGWLRMSHIRVQTESSGRKKDSGVGQTLNFLSTGRSGASGVTVATGIRGLDSADVSKAKPDHEAVKQLNNYKVSAATAKKFATAGDLQEQQLRYFKESK